MEEALIPPTGIPLLGIPAGGVHGVGPVRAARNGLRLLQGTIAAWRQLGRERPAALITTGGYVSAPVAVAAWLRRIPILLYLPDIEPGQAVKFVARLAARIGVTVEASRQYLPARKVVVTGYPLGERVTRWTRAAGRAALGLPPEAPVLLVFGGSRGARSLNQAVTGNLSALLALAEIVHVSGELDWPAVEAARAALPAAQQTRYHAYPYLHEEMGAALAAADLVLSRAGASVLGEFPYFGLPAILVPYPHAWRYQKVNADWLAARGAAVVVEDAALATQLLPTVRELFGAPARREQMAAAARALARPDAARALAQGLVQLAQGA